MLRQCENVANCLTNVEKAVHSIKIATNLPVPLSGGFADSATNYNTKLKFNDETSQNAI